MVVIKCLNKHFFTPGNPVIDLFFKRREQSIVAVNSSVMLYDDCNKKWMHCGTSPGISRVQIYHHTVHNTFRIVGRKVQGHEVVLNCSIPKNMKYNVATPTFHQWRDNRQVYGLNFANLEEAENFSSIIFSALNALAAGVPNPPMTNANAITENGYYHNAGAGHYRNQSTGSAPHYGAPSSEVSYNNGHDPNTHQKIEYQQRFYSNPREVNGWCESNQKYGSDGAGISENTDAVLPNGPCVPTDNGHQQYNPNNSAIQYNNGLSPNPNSHPGQGGAYNLSPYQASTLQASAQLPTVVNSQSASPQYPLNHLSPRQENARAPGGSSVVCTSPSYYVEAPVTVQNANGCSVNGNRIPPPPPLPSFHGDTYNSLGTGIANIKLKKIASGQTQVNSTPPAPNLPPTSGVAGPAVLPASTNSQMMQEMMATLARRKARLRAPPPTAASEISSEALNSNSPAEISNYKSVTTSNGKQQSCSVPLQNSSSMSSAASSSSFSSIQSADSGPPGSEPVLSATGHVNNGTLTMNGPITNASLGQGAVSSSASNSSPMLKKKNEVKSSTQTGLEMNGWDCLKQELLTEMRKELQTVKQDIINGVVAELSKRRC